MRVPYIENRGNKNSREISLLFKVKAVWDLRGVRIIGPGSFLRVRHSSGVWCDRRVSAGCGIEYEEVALREEKT